MNAAASLTHFVVLQGAWLACVVGAAHGHFLAGPAMVALLVAVDLARAQQRRQRFVQFVLLGLGGTLLDSLQSVLGVLAFQGAPTPWLCPLWITALWVHYGLMLGGPLAALRGRYVLAALLGLVGGPLAYGAGVQLGAASFGLPNGGSVIAVAVVWGLASPAALWVVWR